jgi:hypothetical protein
MEGTAVGGDRGEPYAGRTTKRLTGGASLQWERARERERLAGGAGLSVRGKQSAERAGVRAEAGRRWAERGGGARARGGRGRGFVPGIGPTEGGKFFFFFFLPSQLISYLFLFLFAQNYLVDILGVGK